MMHKSMPWDGIPPPRSDYTVMRVEDATGIPLYWGRDTSNRCLLIITLNGDFTSDYHHRNVPLRGMAIDLRNGPGPGQQRLVLTLEQHTDRDLFLGLCKTLINSLITITDSNVALTITLNHLNRWKAFLSGRNSRLLSPEEVRGLMGELDVLRSLYRRTLGQAGAINAWCGPDYSHQDFIFDNRAIEVKTISGRERSIVRISSEDQLESSVHFLYLVTQYVTETTEGDGSLSLNEMVGLIESELTDPTAINNFTDKLGNMGYIPLQHYGSPQFRIHGMRSYHVVASFPKLVRSEPPSGITKVSYSIKLETIASFECSPDIIFQEP